MESHTPHSLLILSDQESLFQSVLDQMESAKARFHQSAYRAVSEFSTTPSDLAVVDVEAFPDSGPESISLFRELGGDTYIVGAFSSDRRKQSVKALESGADAVLAHPFYPRELVKILQRGCARIQATREEGSDALPGYGPVSALAAGTSSMLRSCARSIKDDLSDITKDSPESTNIRKAARDIRQKTDRLEGLAEQLLLYSYSSPPTRSAVDLNEVSARLLEDILSGSQEINVQKTLNAAPSVARGDPSMLEDVFRYVIRERLRHIQTGGTLLVETAPGENGRISLSIWDNGEPLGEDELRNLYEPFGVESSTRSEAGLTYPLARKVARIHDGDFRLTSEPDKGTRATFLLPSHSSVGRV